MRLLMQMTNYQFSRSSGFTLVELMLAITISIFLIGGVVLIQSSSRAASIEAERLSRIQENVRFNSDFLVREMRNAGFRDQLSLTFIQFNKIGEKFAWIENGGKKVTIRYSGRGHCAQGFTTGDMLAAGLVENEYYVNGSDELVCAGSIEDEEGIISSGSVALASGIDDIRFELICPAGSSTPTSNCTSCPLWKSPTTFGNEEKSLDETCYGIRIGLLLEPVGPNADPVPVELSAAFRNIVLGKLMWNAVPPEDSL